MSIVRTVRETFNNFQNYKKQEEFTDDNTDEDIDKNKKILLAVVFLSIMIAIPYIWFGIVYIQDIHPKIDVEGKNLFLFLVYLMVFNYSIIMLNDFIILYLLLL